MANKKPVGVSEYFFDNKYVAGIVLTGTEVKSLSEGKASFNDSYCIIHKGEMWLKSHCTLQNIPTAQ